MLTKQFFNTIFFTLLIGLSSCSKQASLQKESKSTKIQVPTLTSYEPRIIQQTKQQVTIRAKKLNNGDCIKMFGKDGKKLLNPEKKQSPRIHPIQITIENRSNKTLYINKKSLNIKTLHPKSVYLRLKPKNKINNLNGVIFIGLGAAITILTVAIAPFLVAGGVFLGFGVLGSLGTVGAYAGLGLAGLILISGPMVTGVGIGKVVSSLNNNDTPLQKNLNKRNIKNLEIKPQQRADLLIFVTEKNIKPNLEIKLFNKNQKFFNRSKKDLEPEIAFDLNIDNAGKNV